MNAQIENFELTAQFLDIEAQALAELLPRMNRNTLEQLFQHSEVEVRKQRLMDALMKLRVALQEAGFSPT